MSIVSNIINTTEDRTEEILSNINDVSTKVMEVDATTEQILADTKSLLDKNNDISNKVQSTISNTNTLLDKNSEVITNITNLSTNVSNISSKIDSSMTEVINKTTVIENIFCGVKNHFYDSNTDNSVLYPAFLAQSVIPIKYSSFYTTVFGIDSADNIYLRGDDDGVYKLTVSTRSWSRIATIPYNTLRTSGCIHNGSLYIFGGGSISMSSSEIVDTGVYFNHYKLLSDGSWTEYPNLPYVSQQSKALSDGKYIYLIGGEASVDTTYDDDRDIYCRLAYKWDGYTWSQLPTLPIGVGLKASVFIFNKELHAISYNWYSSEANAQEHFVLRNNAWTPEPMCGPAMNNMILPTYNLAATLGGKLITGMNKPYNEGVSVSFSQYNGVHWKHSAGIAVTSTNISGYYGVTICDSHTVVITIDEPKSTTQSKYLCSLYTICHRILCPPGSVIYTNGYEDGSDNIRSGPYMSKVTAQRIVNIWQSKDIYATIVCGGEVLFMQSAIASKKIYGIAGMIVNGVTITSTGECVNNAFSNTSIHVSY